MTLRENDSFVRRANSDGTTDSICRECFVTVCTSARETELERAERGHICDPSALNKWKKMQYPKSG
jgi:hypothetical protein